jgi:hypothetical protein
MLTQHGTAPPVEREMNTKPLFIAAVALSSSLGRAAIVQFVESGTASSEWTGAGGTLSVRSFTLTATYDTSNRSPYAISGTSKVGYSTPIQQGTLSIQGYGTFALVGTYVAWVSTTDRYVGVSPNNISHGYVINGPFNAAVGPWDMTSSIGPLSGPSDVSGPIGTSGGNFYFTSQPSISITFQATVLPVPCTAAIVLAGSVLCAARRRRPKAA